MDAALKVLGLILLVLLIVFAIATVSSWFVMVLINYLFTGTALLAVFGVAKLGLWRAWCLTLLTGLLFKGYSSTTNNSK